MLTWRNMPLSKQKQRFAPVTLSFCTLVVDGIQKYVQKEKQTKKTVRIENGMSSFYLHLMKTTYLQAPVLKILHPDSRKMWLSPQLKQIELNRVVSSLMKRKKVPFLCFFAFVHKSLKKIAKFWFINDLFQQKRAKVRMMLGLAEQFLATRDHHCADIERRMIAVRMNFEKFSVHLANYENTLYTAIGRKSDVNKAVLFL